MRRFVYLQNSVSLYAWTSRGCIIVLNNATSVDIKFLRIDRVYLPLNSDPDQDAEDRLCLLLLHLGAKWFDSLQPHEIVAGVADEDERYAAAPESGEVERLSPMKRRWFSVSIPGGGGTGVWVAEYDTTLLFMEDTHNLVPDDTPKVMLARPLDEKCKILALMALNLMKV